MTFNLQHSSTYQIIHDLLKLIEGLGVPSDEYSLMDSGQTLEITQGVLDRIKDSSQFAAFLSIGGYWYTAGTDSWETELTAQAIANLFEN